MLYTNLCILVARVWERVRVQQVLQEMPFDNIQSVDKIGEVAYVILNTELLQEYKQSKEKTDFFLRNTGKMSDAYIEEQAEHLINKMCFG